MAEKLYPYFTYMDYETCETVYETSVQVSLSLGPVKIPSRMIVDSGGQHTLLNASLAPSLGIDLLKCPPYEVGGITGSTTGRLHEVTIQLEKMPKPFTVTAVFVEKLGTLGLLGQVDFFSLYRARFDKPNLRFYLEEVPVLKF